MLDNKQVNLWRGNDLPPTIYHVWIYDNRQIKLFNGEEWVVFTDNLEILDKLNLLEKKVSGLDSKVNDVYEFKVNDKYIKDNPVLTGKDIKLEEQGTFVSNTPVSDNIVILDKLFNTLMI